MQLVKLKGGNELLANLVNLFVNSDSKPKGEPSEIPLPEVNSEDDIRFENIQSAKREWVKKRSISNVSSDEESVEKEDLKHEKDDIKTIKEAKWPNSVMGFVGHMEIKFGIDEALNTSILAAKVTRKSGHQYSHLKPNRLRTGEFSYSS